tara:strand:+ start:93 stop:599 length:507 start_codon:yes stop_codon:yes gene_type:complete
MFATVAIYLSGRNQVNFPTLLSKDIYNDIIALYNRLRDSITMKISYYIGSIIQPTYTTWISGLETFDNNIFRINSNYFSEVRVLLDSVFSPSSEILWMYTGPDDFPNRMIDSINQFLNDIYQVVNSTDNNIASNIEKYPIFKFKDDVNGIRSLSNLINEDETLARDGI